jgi:predicted nucleotidyltransferase
MNEQEIRQATVLNVVHGSRAYGTNIPGSDYDEKGIAIISDPRYYFGFKKFEQKDSGWADGNDRVIYDVRKFFRLALACNPNIIEVLFVEPEQILTQTHAGIKIRGFRRSFLSRSAAKTFTGYAVSQMKRLQNKVTAGQEINWKHAMHLVRLLRMGHEAVKNGEINVKRKDAAELLEIRSGKVDLDDIMRESVSLIGEIDGLVSNSPLPVEPDRVGAEQLMMELIQEAVDQVKWSSRF